MKLKIKRSHWFSLLILFSEKERLGIQILNAEAHGSDPSVTVLRRLSLLFNVRSYDSAIELTKWFKQVFFSEYDPQTWSRFYLTNPVPTENAVIKSLLVKSITNLGLFRLIDSFFFLQDRHAAHPQAS